LQLNSFVTLEQLARLRTTYLLLTALNSLLSLHIHNPPLFQVELEKKTAGSRWTCFGVRVPRTLNYATVNWNPL